MGREVPTGKLYDTSILITTVCKDAKSPLPRRGSMDLEGSTLRSYRCAASAGNVCGAAKDGATRRAEQDPTNGAAAQAILGSYGT